MLPDCLQRFLVNHFIIELAMPDKPEIEKNAVKNYWQLHISRQSDNERCFLMSFKFPILAHIPLNEKLRDCNFPIAVCFGDRDFLGSEGADDLIL